MGTVNRGKERSKVVVPVLEDAEEAEELAEEALRFIARLERRANLELVIEIGDYLVSKFFGGQLDLARSHSPLKPTSLKMLERKAATMDIPVSLIKAAILLSAQYRALPAAVRDKLTVRQHRALLPVKEPQEKSKLARRALAEKLSGPALSRVVREEHGAVRPGPKAMGEVERSLAAARRALVSSMLENALEPAKVRALDGELRARLLREARTLRERVERITDALSAVR